MNQLKRIGIYINNDKYDVFDIAKKAIDKIQDKGIEPVLLKGQLDIELIPSVSQVGKKKFFKDSDLIIVFGGDGTMLSASRKAAKFGVPLFGINAGKLGFLTEGEAVSYNDLIEKLLKGDVIQENRLMLDCTIYYGNGKNKTYIALNDIVIKNSKLNLMQLKVDANGNILEIFRADGLIISTPTGSTAYSLAASGPIVHPETHTLIVNPINPQNLSNRPFVLPDSIELKITFSPDQKHIIVSMDGQDNLHLDGNDFITIKASKYITKLYRLKDSSYFERIRSKLYDLRI